MLEFNYLGHNFSIKSNDNFEENGYIVTCVSIKNKIYRIIYSNDDIKKLNIGKSENFYNLFKKVSENKIQLEIGTDHVNDCLTVCLKLLEPIEYDIMLNLSYLEDVKEEVYDNVMITKIIKELKNDICVYKNEIIVLKDELKIIKKELSKHDKFNDANDKINDAMSDQLSEYDKLNNAMIDDMEEHKTMTKLKISEINTNIRKLTDFVENNIFVDTGCYRREGLKLIKFKIDYLHVNYEPGLIEFNNNSQKLPLPTHTLKIGSEINTNFDMFSKMNCDKIKLNISNVNKPIDFEKFPNNLSELIIIFNVTYEQSRQKTEGSNVCAYFYNHINLNKLTNLKQLTIECCDSLGSLKQLHELIKFTSIKTIELKNCKDVLDVHILKANNIELI